MAAAHSPPRSDAFSTGLMCVPICAPSTTVSHRQSTSDGFGATPLCIRPRCWSSLSRPSARTASALAATTRSRWASCIPASSLSPRTCCRTTNASSCFPRTRSSGWASIPSDFCN
eukprot:Amastigsp_a339474_984.p4 type:complete len:115 gc:universal Amastigsp_a339474_984:732-1076(+)